MSRYKLESAPITLCATVFGQLEVLSGKSRLNDWMAAPRVQRFALTETLSITWPACGKGSIFRLNRQGRGRKASRFAPPAQIPACATNV
jgi:hypothetical protein